MGQAANSSGQWRDRYTVWALAAAAILIALWFRLYRLDAVPPGICGDEAANGIDALLTLHHSRFEIFYPRNYGREGLFIWLLALSVKLFGNSLTALRVPGVLTGVATVALAFFTTRRLVGFFRGERESGRGVDANGIAFLTAVAIATSHWHITFSRIAFRAILDPLFGLAAVYMMVRLLEAPSRKNAVLAGVVTGAGLYGYPSFRFVVFPLLFLVLFDGWRRKRGIGRCLASCAGNPRLWLYAAVVVVMALPLLRVAMGSPGRFFARADAVSVFAKEKPAVEFADSAAKALGQFHISGDRNWRHNVSGKPALSRVEGVFLLAALLLPLLDRWMRTGVPAGLVRFLTLWTGAGLLPAALTFQGRPHFLRSISAIPPVYMLTGIGFWGVLLLAYRLMAVRWTRRAALVFTVGAGAVICGAGIRGTYRSYFVEWAQHSEVVYGFMNDIVGLAAEAAALPAGATKYLVTDQGWLVDPVRYLADIPDAESMAARGFRQVGSEEALRLPPAEEERYFVPLRVDEKTRRALAAKPQGALHHATLIR